MPRILAGGVGSLKKTAYPEGNGVIGVAYRDSIAWKWMSSLFGCGAANSLFPASGSPT
jgi:hypothetical protein